MAQHNRTSRAFLATVAAIAVMSVATPAVVAAQSAGKADGSTALLVKRQYGKAAERLAVAAQGGNARAQYQLASLYRLGLGVPADLAKARFWFQKAAAQGHVGAARALKRLSVNIPPTEKKPALRGTDSSARDAASIMAGLAAMPSPGQGWLTLAAARGLTDVVSVLLKSNTGEGPQALMAAVRARRAPTTTALLQAGVVPPTAATGGDTAMTLASRPGAGPVLAALLAAPGSAPAQGDARTPAIAAALRNCNVDALQALLAAGAKEDGGSQGAAAQAVQQCSNPSALLSLLSSVSLMAGDGLGRNALWHAAHGTDAATVAAILSSNVDPLSPDGMGLTTLHAAALGGRAENLTLLLKATSNKTEASSQGVTPLMLAAASGCVDCISQLLAAGDDLEARDQGDNTPLMYAAQAAQGAAAKALIAAGANADARNENGDTPGKLLARLGL